MRRSIYTQSALICLLITSCTSQRVIDIHDGFESGHLNQSYWSSWRYLPGDLEFESEIVRSGNRAIRVTLHPGDQRDDEKGTVLERAELSESAKLVSIEDSLYEYAFSLFLSQDFPIDTTRLVLAQWKQYCRSGKCKIDNPVLSLRYEGGEFYISLKTDPEKRILFQTNDEIRNKWLDFKFRIRFSRNSNGEILAWLNNNQIINYNGITAYNQKYGYPSPGYFYFKIGLYRDHMNVPMTVYIDDYSKKEIF